MVVDHEMILLAVAAAFVLGLAGLVFLGVWLTAMLRESQRMTRAVAGLVYQESARIIAGLDRLR
jgi:hypothetical protein